MLPDSVRLPATLIVFALSMLGVFTRPRRWPEAVWTCLGAAVLLLLQLVSPRDVLQVVQTTEEPLLFLLALLLLSALLERSGFFEWAALESARRARGRTAALYRNVFVLGVVCTALLSLDTTAVILTPIVLALVRRLNLTARPFVFACAFVANTASLSFPFSNLTNLLFVDAFKLGFVSFAARMLLPSLVASGINYWLFRRLFRADLPATFEVAALPEAASVIPHRGFFHTALAVLGIVCVGYFVARGIGLQPSSVGLLGAGMLLLAGLLTGRVDVHLWRGISWSIFPFVIGLFVVVQAVQNLGLDRWSALLVAKLPSSPWLLAAGSALLSALGANLLNNLPAALVARAALHTQHVPGAGVYGALLGVNLGPNLIVTGSLATMLVLSKTREQADAPSNAEVFWIGLRVTPWVLLGASLALALTFVLVPG